MGIDYLETTAIQAQTKARNLVLAALLALNPYYYIHFALAELSLRLGTSYFIRQQNLDEITRPTEKCA